MVKAVDATEEYKFQNAVRDVAQEAFLDLRAIRKADAKWLKSHGYPDTRIAAMEIVVDQTLKRLDKMAADHFRKQGG